jgi:hypothetical protein
MASSGGVEALARKRETWRCWCCWQEVLEVARRRCRPLVLLKLAVALKGVVSEGGEEV